MGMIGKKSPFLLRYLLSGLLLLNFSIGHAQEKRTIDGRKYIVHQVEQGQTLYAISRAYSVGVEDLVKANPGSEFGLAIGQELLVPQDAINKKEARSAPVIAEDGELLHTVQRKETLFGIARRYDIDVNDLLQRNPALNSGLREGTTLVIPMAKVTGQSETVTLPAMPQRILDHVVQPGETLFSLSQLYVVPQELIQAANDGLPEGLKAGSTVKIPLRIGVEQPDTVSTAPDLALRQRYKMGMLLPFSVETNDSILAANTFRPQFYELSRIAAQFYAGSKIALDSLEKLGLRADVVVLDQGNGPEVWNEVFKRPEIKGMDLFIGPFHRSAIEELAKVNGNAPIVCPVPQSNKVLLGHPLVNKVSPSRSDLIRHTARYVAQRHARDNIVVLGPDIFADKDLQDQMLRALRDALAEQPVRYKDSLALVPLDRSDIKDLAPHFVQDRINVVVAPSEDVEFVTALVHKLSELQGKYRIALVGMEKWLGINSVPAPALDELNFMFASGSFIDRNDPATQAFISRFRELNSTEPDDYAFLGFDITFFFGKALLQRGTRFHEHFDAVQTRPLHMGFRFTRTGPENGYRNEYAIMLQQKELQLVKAP